MPIGNSSFGGGGEHVDSSSHVQNVLLQRLNPGPVFCCSRCMPLYLQRQGQRSWFAACSTRRAWTVKGHSVLHKQHFQKTRQARRGQGPIADALAQNISRRARDFPSSCTSRRCSCFLLFGPLASKQINTAAKRASRDLPAVPGVRSDLLCVSLIVFVPVLSAIKSHRCSCPRVHSNDSIT